MSAALLPEGARPHDEGHARAAARPGAFLALWNGIARAEWQVEYETWHTLEHVPERVGLPGFIEGRRYRSVEVAPGAPPRYFTLYALETRDALSTPAYREVVANPTAWSARMRPRLNGFLRLPCDLRGSVGQGRAAKIAVVRMHAGAQAPANAAASAWLQGAVNRGELVAACWGSCVPDATFPLANADPDAQPGDIVAVLEHVDVAALRDAIAAATSGASPRLALCAAPTYCEFVASVRRDELAVPTAMRQPAQPHLMARFIAPAA